MQQQQPKRLELQSESFGVSKPKLCSDAQLTDGLGRLHRITSAFQLELLHFIAEFDRRRLWEEDGCHHMGHWLAGHYGVTVSEGLRWTKAARALENLPLTCAALWQGTISFDKVLQLARFATEDTEKQLLSWARRASVNAIRAKADLACRPSLEDTKEVTRNRGLWWDFDLDRKAVMLDALLPAEEGLKVVRTIEGIAARLPEEPKEDATFEQRCADALVALASGGTTAEADFEAAKPNLLLSLDLDVLAGDGDGARLDAGAILHPEVARRLACDCRLQAVVKDAEGKALGIGRRSRNVPAWLMRQLLERDQGCTFPGCHTRCFTAAHHIVHWSQGGATDIDNLVIVCSFHHKLVHEGGWRVLLEDGLRAVWLRPNGIRYEPGPRGCRAPPKAA